MTNGGMKGIKKVIKGSCKESKETFLGSWRKNDFYYIIMKSLVKLLPVITGKIENIINILVHLAKTSTELQVPTGFL